MKLILKNTSLVFAKVTEPYVVESSVENITYTQRVQILPNCAKTLTAGKRFRFTISNCNTSNFSVVISSANIQQDSTYAYTGLLTPNGDLGVLYGNGTMELVLASSPEVRPEDRGTIGEFSMFIDRGSASSISFDYKFEEIIDS